MCLYGQRSSLHSRIVESLDLPCADAQAQGFSGYVLTI